jgi:hypothetical protein
MLLARPRAVVSIYPSGNYVGNPRLPLMPLPISGALIVHLGKTKRLLVVLEIFLTEQKDKVHTHNGTQKAHHFWCEVS